jgi:hypothetical membrane protein
VKVRVGAAMWIVAALGFFVAEAITAAASSDYGYLKDYISTLGVPGRSPRADLMNAAFVAQGVLFPVGAVLTTLGVHARKVLPFLSLASLNGVGNLVVAFVHSGAGSTWHVVGAAVAIAAGNSAVLTGSSVLRRAGGARIHLVASVAIGGLGLLCLLAVALGASPVGLWERGSVYAIFIWQAYTAVYLLSRGS